MKQATKENACDSMVMFGIWMELLLVGIISGIQILSIDATRECCLHCNVFKHSRTRKLLQLSVSNVNRPEST